MNKHRFVATVVLTQAVTALVSGCGGAQEVPAQEQGSEQLARGQDALACTTKISYGDGWIHSGTNTYDVTDGSVTWDGTCVTDGSNSYAVLSNGWKPYFTGKSGCVMALDTTCAGAPTCSTRITYGPAWQRSGSGTYDDVSGRVYWDRGCTNESSNSYTVLSNGWAPHFTGNNACAMSFMFQGCGGLFKNPVVDGSCPDPGVLYDGGRYIATCTGGSNPFPIRTSPDLVTWTSAGSVFTSTSKPSWAASDFWAPEIHKVGSGYMAYFTARHTDGKLSIGAARATSPLGPFTDSGKPLVHDTSMGMIDATTFVDTGGTRYLVWKADGNAVGQSTPIYGQQLSADGLTLVGTRKTLISNDLSWEGGVVEGPWVVAKNGYYYLFYSGNSYANETYAVGVARATSPLGPYTKAGAPILKTGNGWVGPGHCSVVETPSGTTQMIYHAWNSAHTARVMLVDAVTWVNGWPAVPEAPSANSRPMP